MAKGYNAPAEVRELEKQIAQEVDSSRKEEMLEGIHFLPAFLVALCQILLMGHFRRRPVLAPGAAFFLLQFPFDAIGSGR